MAEQSDKKKNRPEVPLTRDVVIKRRNLRQNLQHESPLMTLQEIFEETDDKGRFIGDTMFWKYFEDIDCDRVKDTKSVEYLNLRIMFFETLFYIALLIMFTNYAYFMQNTTVYEGRQEQLRYWGGCDMETKECKLDKVKDIESFWAWMSGEFVPNAFTNYTVPAPKVANILTKFDNAYDIDWSPRFVGPSRSNIFLGTVRLRQLRVEKNKGCEVSKLYKNIYPDCFGKYSSNDESKTAFTPRFVPTYLRPAYKHVPEKNSNQTSIDGKSSSYSGGGFVIDLPSTKVDSLTMINDLHNWYWIDRSTRAIVVELSVLNTNVNVIVNTRILFEFSATGSVAAQSDVMASQVFYFTPSTKSGIEMDVYIQQILLFIMYVFQTFWIFYLMFKTCMNFLGGSQNLRRGCALASYMLKKRPCRTICKGILLFFKTWWHYLRYEWNMVDFMVLVLFYVHISLRWSTYGLKSSQPDLDPKVIGHPEKFMPISMVMVPIDRSLKVLAVLSILTWVRSFKYLCMISHFRLLVRILEKCAAELIIFSALLIIIFFGFSVCFFVAFGGTDGDFSTLPGSFLVLFFLLMDGHTVDPAWFAPGKIPLMPMVFFIYITFTYFVLLNVFLAIVLDVYAITNHLFQAEREKMEDTDKPRENPMFVFIKTYIAWLKGISLIRKEHEEIPSKYHSIELELLPGLVRRKWIEKKRKMQRVADKAFAGLTLFPEDEGVLFQKTTQSGSDWMLPNSEMDFKRMTDATASEPFRVYDIPPSMLKQKVTHAQLQRLMDEDESLPLLLGETRAVKVIKRFQRRSPDDEDEEEEEEDFGEDGNRKDWDNITKTQAEVFARIDAMERIEPEMEVPKVAPIQAMTEDMSHALTEVQNHFRVQLTGIIEATATLFEHLVELTQGIDAVRANHEEVIQLVKENAEEQDYASTQ
jgi:hypothetical protein